MLEATCLMIAWISLMISLSLFSLDTLKFHKDDIVNTRIKSRESNNIFKSLKNSPFLNNLIISLNTKIPPLQDFTSSFAHYH